MCGLSLSTGVEDLALKYLAAIQALAVGKLFHVNPCAAFLLERFLIISDKITLPKVSQPMHKEINYYLLSFSFTKTEQVIFLVRFFCNNL